jgi:hypothetical protein
MSDVRRAALRGAWSGEQYRVLVPAADPADARLMDVFSVAATSARARGSSVCRIAVPMDDGLAARFAGCARVVGIRSPETCDVALEPEATHEASMRECWRQAPRYTGGGGGLADAAIAAPGSITVLRAQHRSWFTGTDMRAIIRALVDAGGAAIWTLSPTTFAPHTSVLCLTPQEGMRLPPSRIVLLAGAERIGSALAAAIFAHARDAHTSLIVAGLAGTHVARPGDWFAEMTDNVFSISSAQARARLVHVQLSATPEDVARYCRGMSTPLVVLASAAHVDLRLYGGDGSTAFIQPGDVVRNDKTGALHTATAFAMRERAIRIAGDSAPVPLSARPMHACRAIRAADLLLGEDHPLDHFKDNVVLVVRPSACARDVETVAAMALGIVHVLGDADAARARVWAPWITSF